MNEQISGEPPPVHPPAMGRWQARSLRRANVWDAVFMAALITLAGLTLWSGRRAGLELSPQAAREVAEMLQGLQRDKAAANGYSTSAGSAP